MNTFTIHIYEASGTFYEGPCEMIIIPSTDGLIGIMANHSNMICALMPGEMTYRLPGEKNQYAAISSGLVKVEDNDVLILAESIERPEEIDANRAQREADEAREAMLQKRSIREFRMAEMELARTANRLKVKRHLND